MHIPISGVSGENLELHIYLSKSFCPFKKKRSFSFQQNPFFGGSRVDSVDQLEPEISHGHLRISLSKIQRKDRQEGGIIGIHINNRVLAPGRQTGDQGTIVIKIKVRVIY